MGETRRKPPATSAAWAREPLVHFMLLGALLFALDAALGGEEAPVASAPEVEPTVERRIVVSEAVRREVTDDFRREHDRAPDEAELRAQVDRWIDDEVLYREALERGLWRHDQQVRARLATLMADIALREQVVEPPTDAELRAVYDADPSRWATPSRVDFVHVFTSAGPDGETTARGHLDALRSGASPARMGETFSGGRHYRGRRLEELSTSFGPDFAEVARTAPIDEWTLAPSRFGWHVVRVEQRSLGGAVELEAAREDVLHAVMEERRDEAFRAALAALREHWTIDRGAGAP